MKTVSQVVEEYKNRQKNPKYNMVVFGGRTELVYHNVTNLVEVGDYWEFDSVYRGKSSHLRILADPIVLDEFVEVEQRILKPDNKKYKKIVVCTHSGERETFLNVSNIIEDVDNGVVEFDMFDASPKIHVVKNPGSLEHSEEII